MNIQYIDIKDFTERKLEIFLKNQLKIFKNLVLTIEHKNNINEEHEEILKIFSDLIKINNHIILKTDNEDYKKLEKIFPNFNKFPTSIVFKNQNTNMIIENFGSKY